jgi:hypothetical protein
MEIGIARAAGAVLFSVVIGLLMHLAFRREEAAKVAAAAALPPAPPARPLVQEILYFASMVGILVFANLAAPADAGGAWQTIYAAKWWITAALAAAFALMLVAWLELSAWKVGLAALVTAAAAVAAPHEPLVPFAVAVLGLSVATSTDSGAASEWFAATWEFAKQVLPLLLLGVLFAGLLLGRPGHEGLIPSEWVSRAVGGNSVGANLFASVAGAFMYFATLTEVPIVQGLMGSGMGKGPALALLLAGPALSLPSMLVLTSLMGLRKTVVYVSLVVVMATITGVLFGALP